MERNKRPCFWRRAEALLCSISRRENQRVVVTKTLRRVMPAICSLAKESPCLPTRSLRLPTHAAAVLHHSPLGRVPGEISGLDMRPWSRMKGCGARCKHRRRGPKLDGFCSPVLSLCWRRTRRPTSIQVACAATCLTPPLWWCWPVWPSTKAKGWGVRCFKTLRRALFMRPTPLASAACCAGTDRRSQTFL